MAADPDSLEAVPEETDPAVELTAMSAAANALRPLSADSRRRAIAWLAELFNTPYTPSHAPGVQARPAALPAPTASTTSGEYETFADMFDALSPRNDAERVLSALYWLQVFESRPSAKSLDMTKLLTDLGHRVDRVRTVLPALQSTKPALVIQVSHGSGAHGRRVVKLTAAGIKRVQAALSAGGFESAE